ncbi:MAG TPA: methyltransferase domain-containing protein [Bacilli bacterium]|nr:methyltransferase domain-containing protein [Bacilli bacterium]HPZ23409.1 methyltransferase domain-containing protein [Bacilli bacterium]HQC84121.1 methyltransferase domain-containing protein [Bacilli bacterium]
MNEKELIEYYNKFNEDKRLNTKHAWIEYQTTLKYIHDYLNKGMNILDVGAGTGKYAIYLADEGYDVSAVELVKHNLRVMESKTDKVKCFQGNALDLSRFKDNSFSIVLLLGPMYHLISNEDKVKALKEAKRVVKDGGYIFISYCMNEYAILKHGFIDGNIISAYESKMIDDKFHILSKSNDLYSFVRLEDINHYKDEVQLKRIKIVSQDGAAEYIKKEINKMDDKSLNLFLQYHLCNCERPELLGAGRHILDILQK